MFHSQHTQRFVGVLAVAIALVVLLPISLVRGAEDSLPMASPQEVGMSAERLQRVSELMQRNIDQDLLAGTVTLIARHGKVAHLEAQGFNHKEADDAMATDDIFVIMSMTKPIVTVALMMLYEEGYFRLDDPISRWLPAYADKTVRQTAEGRTVTEPAADPVTVRQILTHTSGLSIRPPGPRGGRAGARPATLSEAVDFAADVPLAFHPGTEWQYGASTDYVAILVEKISGMSLDDFLRERIFEPLGMDDTHYNIPESKIDRIAAVYRPTGPDNTIELFRAATRRPPTRYFGGQAGLNSTAADYFRFHQMMLNGGELNGTRILSRKTVESMLRDHLGGIAFRTGQGFGLGFSLTHDPAATGLPGSVGEFGWGGAYHSTYWADPEEELVVVYLTQLIPAINIDDHQKVRTMIYQAIID